MKKQACAALLYCALSAYAIPAHAETAVTGVADTAAASTSSSSESAAASGSTALATSPASKDFPDLTLAEAMQLGIEYSPKLQQALNTYKRNGINLDKAADNLDYIPSEDSGSAEDRSAWKNYTSSNISYIAALKNIDTVKQQIGYSMIQTYYNVLSAESNVEDAEESLGIARLEEKTAAAKLAIGKISVAEQESVQRARVEAEQALATAESALVQERKTLNNAIGAGANDRFNLVDRPQYQEFKELDVGAYAVQMTSTDPTIWQAEKNVEMAKLDLKYFTWNSDGDMELTKMDVEEADQELTQSKKDLEQSISSTYHNLKNLHDQYKQQQTNLTTAKEELDLAGYKYARGLITAREVKTAEHAMNQAQRKLDDLVMQIDEAQRKLDQPWVS